MRPAGAIALGLVAGSACGDNLADGHVIDAISGSRLSVYWFGYDDGSRQLAFGSSTLLYDRDEHTACNYGRTADDVERCLPDGEQAIYTDAACTQAIGRASTMLNPRHFLANDFGTGHVDHVYRAGSPIAPPRQYYDLSSGRCNGPYSSDAASYYSVAAEIEPDHLVALHFGDTVGDGRVAMAMLTGSDGLRLPIETTDRELDASCSPTRRADGSVVCAPGYQLSPYFRDPACTQAVAVVFGDNHVPPAVQSIGPAGGCPIELQVGEEVTGPVYRVSGGGCVQTPIGAEQHVFAADTPIDAPVLTEHVESEPRQRLQRIVLGDGDLRFYDGVMYDTAFGGLCSARAVGDGAQVYCMPAVTADALYLYNAGCRTHVYVAEVSPHACQRPRFAETGGQTPEVRPIGELAGTVYTLVGSTCQPYVPTPGTELYRLGAAIEAKAFERGLYYGAR